MWILALLLIGGLLIQSWIEMGETNSCITHSDLLDPNPRRKDNLGEFKIGFKNQLTSHTSKKYAETSDLVDFWATPIIRELFEGQSANAGLVCSFLAKSGNEKVRWYVSMSYNVNYELLLRQRHPVLNPREMVISRFIQKSLMHILFCDKLNGAGKITLDYKAFEDVLKMLDDSVFFVCHAFNARDVKYYLNKELALLSTQSYISVPSVQELSVLNVHQIDENRVQVLYSTALVWGRKQNEKKNKEFSLNGSPIIKRALKPLGRCVPLHPSKNLEYAMMLVLNKWAL